MLRTKVSGVSWSALQNGDMRPIVNKAPPAGKRRPEAVLAGRISAGVAGIAATAGALWGSLWVMLMAGIAGTQPDAGVEDGDPCCATPDSWGQAAEWAGGAAFFGVIDGLAFAIAASCFWFALHGRWARPGLLALAPAAAGLLVALAVGIAQAVQAL